MIGHDNAYTHYATWCCQSKPKSFIYLSWNITNLVSLSVYSSMDKYRGALIDDAVKENDINLV